MLLLLLKLLLVARCWRLSSNGINLALLQEVSDSSDNACDAPGFVRVFYAAESNLHVLNLHERAVLQPS